MDELEFCEVCGQVGQPSWGMTLCESCTGAAGATCAGLRKDEDIRKPAISLPDVC